MGDPKIISPATELRASRAGILPGIVLVVWAVAFWFFKSSMAPSVYWTVLVSVSLLIVAVPSWIVGRRARREYLERNPPSA